MDITPRGAPQLEEKRPIVQVTDSSVRIVDRRTGQSLLAGPVETLARASTGSGTFVYRVRTVSNEYVVLKVAKQRQAPTRLGARARLASRASDPSESRRREILAGLRHEREVYKLFTALVRKQITPFVLMHVDVDAPDNVITTESDAPGNLVSLSQYLRTHQMSYRQARTLVFQLVYTIEVFYRIGARHNDVHLGNVMMARQRGGSRKRMRIVYMSRRYQEHEFDLPMYEWQPRIYDFDRVFKRRWPRLVATQLEQSGQRLPSVVDEFANRLDPSPVTDRFPWHDPRIDTSKFNVMKVLQHIRDAANRNQDRNLLMAVQDLTLTRQAILALQRKYGLDRRTWYDYYIPESVHTRKEANIGNSLKSPEDMILLHIGTYFRKSQARRPDLTVSMRNLYNNVG